MKDVSVPATPETFYRSLVENAAEGMLTIDAESRIVYANPAVEEILGYSPEELIGSSKMKIIPERLQPIHAQALSAYVESGTRNIDWGGVELPALHKDGHEVPTLISLREHEYDGEQYFTGIIRDVTERKNRERELQAQKERLDDFADILAHDIRNPLSIARGYTDIAREKRDDGELDRVTEALDRIDCLVDDVLALSKEGRRIGDTESVALEALVREAWDSVDTEEATLRIDGDLGSVNADRSRFLELLANLFRNSVEHGFTSSEESSGDGDNDASNNGGAPTVTVGPISGGFFVADDGPGIPEPIRDDVFEHGYSTRDYGTGFGLSIVDQIADAHGWDVDLVDTENGGTRFEIRTGD